MCRHGNGSSSAYLVTLYWDNKPSLKIQALRFTLHIYFRERKMKSFVGISSLSRLNDNQHGFVKSIVHLGKKLFQTTSLETPNCEQITDDFLILNLSCQLVSNPIHSYLKQVIFLYNNILHRGKYLTFHGKDSSGDF